MQREHGHRSGGLQAKAPHNFSIGAHLRFRAKSRPSPDPYRDITQCESNSSFRHVFLGKCNLDIPSLFPNVPSGHFPSGLNPGKCAALEGFFLAQTEVVAEFKEGCWGSRMRPG